MDVSFGLDGTILMGGSLFIGSSPAKWLYTVILELKQNSSNSG